MVQRVTNYDKPLTIDLTKHPIDQEGGRQLLRHIARLEASQGVAATATLLLTKVMRDPGRIVRTRAMTGGDLAAAGEDMSCEVLKNGVTVLTGPIVLDSSSTVDTYVLGVLTGDAVAYARGDLITIALTYTPGGGATPMTNTLVEVDIEYNN